MNIRRLRALRHYNILLKPSGSWPSERGSLIFETVHQRQRRQRVCRGSQHAEHRGGQAKRSQQSIIRDISDRKRAEQELSESESRFRQLVESAPYGILVVEGQIILYANPEAVRMFGAAAPADLVGHSLLERARAEEHESMQRRMLEAMAGRSPVVERRYLRLNGEEFWAAVSAAEIEYDQRPAGLLFYRDITAAKRAEEEHARLEEQLRQSQKMESVGRLAGGVAHDFNNYLTVINGYCEMLLAGSDAGPGTRESLQEIRAAGERAASITQQLLAFSRKQIATPTVLSLNQVVTDSGQLLQRLIGEDIKIVTRLHRGSRQCDGGPAATGPGPDEPGDQCARCHAGRRADHRSRPAEREIDESGGVATPRCRPGRYSVLSVADTGVGMSAEIQQRIFEPFFTTKGVGTGTGLGLSTAYGIVRHAGGWIDVQSSRGTGSRFEVWLPLTDARGCRCRRSAACRRCRARRGDAARRRRPGRRTPHGSRDPESQRLSPLRGGERGTGSGAERHL